MQRNCSCGFTDTIDWSVPRNIIIGTSEARKFDEGKLRYDLIPPEALEELAKVLTFGASKYDDRNWEKGMAWGRMYGALQRHLNAWRGGQLDDPETGYSHLSHALFCLSVLSVYERRGIGENNLHV